MHILFITIILYSDIMNNKVFYQHPNLMRALGMHETVMEVMVNVLSGGDSKVRTTDDGGFFTLLPTGLI